MKTTCVIGSIVFGVLLFAVGVVVGIHASYCPAFQDCPFVKPCPDCAAVPCDGCNGKDCKDCKDCNNGCNNCCTPAAAAKKDKCGCAEGCKCEKKKCHCATMEPGDGKCSSDCKCK
jgi:hypothetical protein